MRATQTGLISQGAQGTRRRLPRLAQFLGLLISALALPLAACNVGLGSPSTSAAYAPNQLFVWPYVDAAGVIGHNEIMDPAQVTTLKDTGTISMLYIGLVTYKPDLTVQGDAAKTWSVDNTGTIYTFHLRPNLKFSDGTPITASDFAYSLDRALDPNLCPVDSAKTYYSPNADLNTCAQPSQVYLSYILGAQDRLDGTISTLISNGDDPRAGLNVLDPLTLRIRLSQPVSFFLESLTYTTADVLEKSFIDKPGNGGGLWVDHLDQGGTSGPFKIKSYGNGKQMTFVPNPYWEKAFGKTLTLTQVVRPVVANQDTEYSSYGAGQYDYTDVPASEYAFARGQADFHDLATLQTDYFGLNFTKAPFDNLKVRQALDLALNKQLLVDRVENGGAVPTNHIVPQGMPGFNPNLKNPAPDGTQSLTGNQQAALTLLNQARGTCPAPGSYLDQSHQYCAFITGQTPQEIDLYAPTESQATVQIAQLAAQAWNQALQLNIVVKPVSFDRLVGYLTAPTAAQDPMQMWEIAWIADYPDPQDWLTLQFSTTSVYNSEGISIQSLDTLMSKADTEQDSVKRMQMYNQAEQLIVDQCAWIPYQQAKLYWRQRSYVRGFGFNSIGLMPDINWPSVYIAQH